MRRMAGAVEPLKSRSSTWRWVTLQRPPPAIRILAPRRLAPSIAQIRAPGADHRDFDIFHP
jgi:hypothetical protein